MSESVTSPSSLTGEPFIIVNGSYNTRTPHYMCGQIHQVIGRTSLQRTMARIDTPEPSHGRVLLVKNFGSIYAVKGIPNFRNLFPLMNV